MRACSSRKSFSASPPRGTTTSALAGSATSAASSSREASSAIAASARQAARVEAGVHRLEQRRVGGAGRARAAQDRDVAALQAQRGDVDGHVRARLVDHQHAAQRHAHADDVEVVRKPPAGVDLAARVGQRRDRPRRGRRARRSARRRASGGRAAPPTGRRRGPARRPRRSPRGSPRGARRCASAIACSAASFGARPSARERPAARRGRGSRDRLRQRPQRPVYVRIRAADASAIRAEKPGSLGGREARDPDQDEAGPGRLRRASIRWLRLRDRARRGPGLPAASAVGRRRGRVTCRSPAVKPGARRAQLDGRDTLRALRQRQHQPDAALRQHRVGAVRLGLPERGGVAVDRVRRLVVVLGAVAGRRVERQRRLHLERLAGGSGRRRSAVVSAVVSSTWTAPWWWGRPRRACSRRWLPPPEPPTSASTITRDADRDRRARRPPRQRSGPACSRALAGTR